MEERLMDAIRLINYTVTALFVLCYAYQFFYLAVALFKKPSHQPEAVCRRYGVVIAARNEEKVISQLIASVKAQNYPSELIDIFVVADNCTDNTVEAASSAGAVVWERENLSQIGKGYALSFIFDKIKSEYNTLHDGFFIFDADNLLDEDYISEMNKTFACGYSVVTSYRNSKNPGSSWISSGHTLQFMRESAHLNAPRMTLKTACMVSGTGFLISREIIERNNGWKHCLLTEDIEFTVDCILHGDRMGYCGSAVFYDEQPVTFAQSWTQRLRWAKGYLQVFRKYCVKLFCGMFRRDTNRFACFDIMMSVIPAIILTTASVFINIAVACASLFVFEIPMISVVSTLLFAVLGAYFMFLFMGIMVSFTEWHGINCGSYKKIIAVFMFPLFMMSYMPVAAVALFSGKVEWKAVRHNMAMTLRDVRSGN
jgi:cellulose synthase/poly-beta-1,6-N-acetylglucosamine synthase-like glycosyltransferase